MTEKEIKTIKRYYTWPVTAAAYLCTGLLAMLVWIFLDMIRSVVFHLRGSSMGVAYVSLAVLLVYMVLFVIQAFSVIRGARGRRWAAIQEKARTYTSYSDRRAEVLAANAAIAAGRLMSRSDDDKVKAAGDISTAIGGAMGVHAIVCMLLEVRRGARRIADAQDIRLPSVKLRVAAIILIPLALLTAVAAPYYVRAVRESRAGAARAAEVIGVLEEVFQTACDSVYADDPMESYRDYGYQVTGNLYHGEGDIRSYLAVTVNNDGAVEEVTYCLDVDVSASKEDNLTRVSGDLEVLNRALRSADVPFLSPNLREKSILEEDFVERFRENSYYESYRIRYEAEGLFLGYYTESREDYNDYSNSYLYITVEPPEGDG